MTIPWYIRMIPVPEKGHFLEIALFPISDRHFFRIHHYYSLLFTYSAVVTSLILC